MEIQISNKKQRQINVKFPVVGKDIGLKPLSQLLNWVCTLRSFVGVYEPDNLHLPT